MKKNAAAILPQPDLLAVLKEACTATLLADAEPPAVQEVQDAQKAQVAQEAQGVQGVQGVQEVQRVQTCSRAISLLANSSWRRSECASAAWLGGGVAWLGGVA